MTIKKKIKLADLCFYPAKSVMPFDSKQIEAIKDFNSSVRDGKIGFEEVSCLCGNDTFYQVADIDRYGFNQSTVICTKCGLILSNPRMTKVCYERFYKSDAYRRLYDTENYLDAYESLYKDNRGLPIFETVSKFKTINKMTKVLEFGAGGGWNLLPFIEAGVIVKGYDYSRSLTELGKKKGIDLEQGSIDDIKGIFDVVIINHVIEHLTDFFQDIKKIISHLKDDGIVYIGVPNILNFHIGQIQNAHTYYFDPKTFKYYLARCGLKTINFNNEEPGGHMSGIFIKGGKRLSANYLKMHFLEYYLKMRFDQSRAIINGMCIVKLAKKSMKYFINKIHE